MTRSPAAILYDAAGNPISSMLEGSDRRLMVEATFSGETSVVVVPPTITPGAAVNAFLKNGSSRDMNVDGSTTPVVFEHAADQINDACIKGLRFVLECSSLKMGGADFGADSMLGNGVKLELTSGGVTAEILNITVNDDFLAMPSVGLPRTIYDGPSGDQLVVNFDFGGRVPLLAGTSDRIAVTVRDDIQFSSSHKIGLFWAVVYGVSNG